MKKLLVTLLSLLLIVGVFVLEGGAVSALFCFSAFVPIFFGTILSALFSYPLNDVSRAIKDGFSETVETNKIQDYHADLGVIRSMSAAIVFWTLTIAVLAAIAILSGLRAIEQIGPPLAAGMTALLYGFGLKAVILIPLENSLLRKILIVETSEN
ncbi:MAG: hypothetical protein ACM3PP_11445 [Candidatus Saccharibacteria bacterium]